MAGMFDWMKGGGKKNKGRRRSSGGKGRGGGGGGRRRAPAKRDPANATEFIGGDAPAAHDDPTPAPPAAVSPSAPAPPPPAPGPTATPAPPAVPVAPAAAPAPAPPAPAAPVADSAATQYHAVGPVGGGVVAVLICKDGTARDEIYKVFDGENIIGRGDEAQIRTDPRDQSISRAHAQIIHESGNFGIKPLKEGTNPTFLNEDEVSGGAPLGDGDLIRVGNTILKFRVS